ncbi:hypothetical protein R1sor_017052 [Riccia sorocarpa]|uniref:RING-type E3 ubiquitin transferase n=1 Tax=Riccia sorocarpa TaxID=122646 RepID=A0ABD3I5P4_9MARC
MVDGGPSDSLSMVNVTPQPVPNASLSISLPFLSQAAGNLGVEGDQSILTRQPPGTPVWNLPPPPCLMNTFIQGPQLTPSDASLLQQATSSDLPVGSFVPESTVSTAFFHDLRHHRGYSGLLNLPPAFQLHPNMQNQLQNDLNQHAHMAQSQGFLPEAEGEYGDINVMVTDPSPTRVEDTKLKGIEEPYTTIGENFECNICFQKANEPIVTCCGHLFCWPCVYRWLHIHSYHKECPVCKGAIDEKSVIPIYGRECNGTASEKGRLPGGSTTEHIPPRPSARRVESARQLQEREDRIRAREQRERALERSQNLEQQDDSPDLIQVIGSGLMSQAEQATVDDEIIQSITEMEDEITNEEANGNSNLGEITSLERGTHDSSGSPADNNGTSSQTLGLLA